LQRCFWPEDRHDYSGLASVRSQTCKLFKQMRFK